MKKVFIGMCIIGMYIGSAYAECRKISEGIFECDGYKIELSGCPSGNRLIVKGRVSEGKACNNLRISATLINKSGDTINAHFTASNVGPGKSDILRYNPFGGNRTSCFFPESVTANCHD